MPLVLIVVVVPSEAIVGIIRPDSAVAAADNATVVFRRIEHQRSGHIFHYHYLITTTTIWKGLGINE